MKNILLLFYCILLLSPCQDLLAQKSKGLPDPKNIIFLIGDGVGYNHILATDFYSGVASQEYEKFPVRLAMCHYPAKTGAYGDQPSAMHYATGYNTVLAWTLPSYLMENYTESSAAATALATGVKTYNGSIGISLNGDTLVNLVEWAKAMGKAAGVVTSVQFSHATPAGFVAHNANRTNYPEIAYQMILESRCDVIMGCGDPMFDDNGISRGTKWMSSKYVGDSSFWSQLIARNRTQVNFSINGKIRTVSDINGDKRPDPWTLVRTKEEFKALEKGNTPKRVLGVPNVYSTLQQSRSLGSGEGKDSPPFMTPFLATVPTLAGMVNGALNVLDNNPKGFFIMIEGGATDWASHGNEKGRLIEEMTDFNEAVNAVIRWVERNSNWEETLVIVTGDHETGFLWGGNPFIPLKSREKGNLPEMNFNSGDHTNSLIPFYAKGAGSDLFKGFADETDSVRGPYIQNSEIAQLVRLLWVKQR